MGQYVKMFEETLSHDHVKALAALFGWNAPSCDEVCSIASISVVLGVPYSCGTFSFQLWLHVMS